MAAKGNVYRGEIQLADNDRGIYESLVVSTIQHPSENTERLVLRLLAFALFHEPDLAFRDGVCSGDEPDLAVRNFDQRITLWLDVGTPAGERLQKAARHCERVVVLTHDGLLRKWKKQHGEQLPQADGLECYSLEQPLIDRLITDITPRFSWSLTRLESRLYLDDGNHQLESQLTRL